jgi:hypothetical protein
MSDDEGVWDDKIVEILRDAAIALGMPYPKDRSEDGIDKINRTIAMIKAADAGHFFAIEALSWYSSSLIGLKERLEYMQKYARLALPKDNAKIWRCVSLDVSNVLINGDKEDWYNFGHILGTYFLHRLGQYTREHRIMMHALKSKTQAEDATLAWCWCAKYHLGFYPDLIRLVGSFVWAQRKTWLQ